MFGTSSLWMVLCALLSLQVNGLRFPGSKLQRQESAAPYPAAGLMPDPPFELPTEQEAPDFPQPDVTYGPPDEVYGPPDEVYGPPDEVYGPPDETYGPPVVVEVHDQTYGPPELPTAQSAATISLASIRPQLQFVLPLVQRFAAFRSVLRPVQPQRRPAKLTVRPQRRPAKVINGIRAAFPATQLTLPFVERRSPFRAQRLIVNAPLRRKPSKLTGPTIAQLTPAIRRPIYSGGHIIAFSDKVQNW